MKAFYFWIGSSVALLLVALFFSHAPEKLGWMITLALFAAAVGLLVKVCRNS